MIPGSDPPPGIPIITGITDDMKRSAPPVTPDLYPTLQSTIVQQSEIIEAQQLRITELVGLVIQMHGGVCTDEATRLVIAQLKEERRDWMSDVIDFHRAFELLVGTTPTTNVPKSDRKLRRRLHREEVMEELDDALVEGNLNEIADGIADSIYVLLGTAASYGIDMHPIWDAVHDANMAKIGGYKDEDGKWVKPDDWTPPPIESLLKSQASLATLFPEPPPGEPDAQPDQ